MRSCRRSPYRLPTKADRANCRSNWSTRRSAPSPTGLPFRSFPRRLAPTTTRSPCPCRSPTPRNRLLYVEGPPRWESKYLTQALKANSRVTPLCFIRGPDRKFMTIGERGDMTADMTPTQLGSFKIVVLGDLDAEELTEARAANLLKFVEDGGSLVLLGGPKAWGKSGFLQSSLKKLVPAARQDDAPIEGKFPTRLTETGIAIRSLRATRISGRRCLRFCRSSPRSPPPRAPSP